MFHYLPATPDSCQWGHFSHDRPPVLAVDSGDIVFIECISHRAGDAPDYMMDDGVRRIFETLGNERGPGPHIVTGPIAVRDTMPGDVLEVRYLAAEPRILYASNLAAHWGLLYHPHSEKLAPSELTGKEHVVVYAVHPDQGVAVPLFRYEYPYRAGDRQYGGIVDPSSVTRHPIAQSVAVPLRPHMGLAGVAEPDFHRTSTVPPGIFGGNVDNRSFVPGTRMYYPVQVPGAWFWTGDTHFAEGDGEISGTAIEGHLNVTVQFIVHKDQPLRTPVLETPTAFMVHGFDQDLDRAMAMAAREMVAFLVNRWQISEVLAYSLISGAGDFRVTQVVNTVKGVHAVIRKDLMRPGPRN